MNPSARARPISPSSFSSSLPAEPTNDRPCLSSLAPGASPTNIRSASALPAPKTIVVRRASADDHQVGVAVARPEDHRRARRGQLRALLAPAGLLVDGLQRLA